MESEQDSNDISREPRELNLVAWYGTIAGLCAIILGGSFFITRAYLENHRENRKNWRPGKIGRLEDDLKAVNRDGREVSLSELKGKIYVAGYQYTDCPGGCLGMASVMKELHDKYRNNPKFHLVSISVNPNGDTPEKMDAWVKDKGVDAPNWWFLTGDAEKIKNYMLRHFKFYATEENTDPLAIATQGQWAHDQRLVIVDGEANIRGYYGVMDVEGGETAVKLLKRDLDMILNPEKKLADYPEIRFPVTQPEVEK
ncbi:MAG: SCO family protein [Verrucomicrobiales bacterium]|nr:SCO family protein [Verrucomicrobiales bacterium]